MDQGSTTERAGEPLKALFQQLPKKLSESFTLIYSDAAGPGSDLRIHTCDKRPGDADAAARGPHREVCWGGLLSPFYAGGVGSSGSQRVRTLS